MSEERPSSIEREPSCEDVVEPALLPVIEARRRIAARLVPLAERETLALADAAARVLAEDVNAPFDVPARANSAMDGYAIDRVSIPATGEATLALVGTAWAGRPFAGRLAAGQAVRIFTGGVIGTTALEVRPVQKMGWSCFMPDRCSTPATLALIL